MGSLVPKLNTQLIYVRREAILEHHTGGGTVPLYYIHGLFNGEFNVKLRAPSFIAVRPDRTFMAQHNFFA